MKPVRHSFHAAELALSHKLLHKRHNNIYCL